MSTADLNNKLLKESINIANILINRAKKDKNGYYWETMSMDTNNNILWVTGESIYSGVSGIVLFFDALYKVTNDTQYLSIAESAANWVYCFCKNNQTSYYALYTGRLSVSIMLLKLYDTTKKEFYKHRAKELALNCESFLTLPSIANDLINGIAGVILGLLHLHSYLKEDWIINLIDKFTKKLINNCHFHKSGGLYWDRSEKQICGLCGYSHGAAGIGFVFLELGHYFNNPSFYIIAELAFLYENSWYDKEKTNWPDLRQHLFTQDKIQEKKQALLSGNVDSFVKGKDMNAWCHGAAGIGHSRLRANQLLKKEIYKQDYTNACVKVKKTDLDNPYALKKSFTLCHGSGGNADLLIETNILENNLNYLELAKRIAQNSLIATKQYGRISGFRFADKAEDLSLFMGNAGIGYFYLRVIDPKSVKSILSLPVYDKYHLPKQAKTLSIGIPRLIEQLLQKPFGQTIRTLKSNNLGIYNELFNKKNEEICFNPIWAFIDKLDKEKPNLDKEILAVYSIEKQKIELDFNTQSHSLLYISELVSIDKYRNEANFDINKLTLMLNNNCRIIENNSTTREFLLLKATPYETKEFAIDQFSYSILELTLNPIPYHKLETEILSFFGKLSNEEENIVKSKIKDQTISMLKANVITSINS